jgi:acetyltransferase-like isoleucine patch superfamily enzyme
LTVAKITIGEDAFVGARAFVLPGVKIGARAVVGACSVVTKDVPDNVIAAGNPCRVIRPR